MTEVGWTVLAGVAVLAIWAITRYVISAIATSVVVQMQTRWKADIAEALEPIHAELTYNGGTSLKDMVRRIEHQVEQLHIR